MKKSPHNIRYTERELLAPHTTFGIGGPARFFIEAKSEEDIINALDLAEKKSLPTFILGRGSNVLISDEGFNGVVIRSGVRGVEHATYGKYVQVTAGSWESWDSFVRYCVKNKWAGIECLSGIPGSVGAAPVQNIGAYGQEIGKHVISITAVDTNHKTIVVLDKKNYHFSYRDSLFKSIYPGRYVITRVKIELEKKHIASVKYRDYRGSVYSYLKQYNIPPTLRGVRRAVLSIRKHKGMLVGLFSMKSAGSFFKNPVVHRKEWENIRTLVERMDKNKAKLLRPWYWKTSKDQVKISAGFLIEYTSFYKGYRINEAGISPFHILSLVNCGNAQAKDIIHLALRIQGAVEKIFKIKLEPEVQCIGFKQNPLL